MNEISFIYYGEFKDVGEHLLFLLNVLKIKPANLDYSGFYILEKKFGFVSQRKISLTLKPNEDEVQDFLVYRYLSTSELDFINSHESNVRFYILLHKYINAEYFKNNLNIGLTQASIIVDYSRTSTIQNYHYVKKYWPSAIFTRISTEKIETSTQTNKDSTVYVPVFVLFLMKMLFNPISELKHYALLLKYSNLRILSRSVELLIFLDFLFKIIFVRFTKIAIQQLYYKTVIVLGVLKILMIKLGFAIRHVILILGFKSFGLFVDTFNYTVRVKDSLIIIFVYKLRHYLFFCVGQFLYYKVGYFLVNNLYLGLINAFYFIRHRFYMTVFKVYGLFYDLAMMSHSFVKLVLLYPFRKAYWFTSFQYDKRIKKYFKDEA